MYLFVCIYVLTYIVAFIQIYIDLDRKIHSLEADVFYYNSAQKQMSNLRHTRIVGEILG